MMQRPSSGCARQWTSSPYASVRDQYFDDESQMLFAQRFDGELHVQTGRGVLEGDRRRLKPPAMTDISNLDENHQTLGADDARRIQGCLANRLWHTDASFTAPPGHYSMLSARGKKLPPSGGETEYADMRAAYDALPDELKERVEGQRAFHSIVYSRSTIGSRVHARATREIPQRRGASGCGAARIRARDINRWLRCIACRGRVIGRADCGRACYSCASCSPMQRSRSLSTATRGARTTSSFGTILRRCIADANTTKRIRAICAG